MVWLTRLPSSPARKALISLSSGHREAVGSSASWSAALRDGCLNSRPVLFWRFRRRMKTSRPDLRRARTKRRFRPTRRRRGCKVLRCVTHFGAHDVDLHGRDPIAYHREHVHPRSVKTATPCRAASRIWAAERSPPPATSNTGAPRLRAASTLRSSFTGRDALVKSLPSHDGDVGTCAHGRAAVEHPGEQPDRIPASSLTDTTSVRPSSGRMQMAAVWLGLPPWPTALRRR
jgi:hypothetical protein